MRTHGFPVAFYSAIVFAVANAAGAGMIVVDNLGEPGPSGGMIAGSGVFGPSAGATQFIVGPGNWSIEVITIRVEELTANNPDQVVLRVLNDAAGIPGSTVLGTLAPVGNITSLASYVFTPVAPIALVGGAAYWLGGFATAVNANYPWRVTPSEFDNGALGWSIGTNAYTAPGVAGPWGFADDRSAMFRIEATPAAVPEPGCAVLLGLALAGTAFAARRRREGRATAN